MSIFIFKTAKEFEWNLDMNIHEFLEISQDCYCLN